MKIITVENYFEPDEITKHFGAVNYETGEQWPITEVDIIGFADKIQLLEIVPEDIKELVEVSKALYSYGYLYWTFFSLAQEQSFKAFEASITAVHKEVYGSNYVSNGKRRLSASAMTKNLMKSGNIPKEKDRQYWAIRQLRNMSFHPSMQSQWGLASYDTIKDVVNEINSSFLSINKL